MNVDLLLAQVKDNADPLRVIDLAQAALTACREEEALPSLTKAISKNPLNPELWQWQALLFRALDQHEQAIHAFEKAAQLKPRDPLLSHSLARTVLEAGQPASALFERAAKLDPANAEILQGRAAARYAEGSIAEAQAEIDGVLSANPGWLQGHHLAAKLRWMQGDRTHFVETVERALVRFPRDPALWATLVMLLAQAGEFERIIAVAVRSRAAIGIHQAIDVHVALALSELGRADAADAQFATIDSRTDVSIAIHHIRHLIRTRRFEEAAKLIEPWLGGPTENLVWPYLSLVWRLVGDPRWAWLEDPSFIQLFDFSKVLPLESLTNLLRATHQSSTEQFDQSVRLGSQTDGMIFQRIEPEFRLLRTAMVDAVSDYLRKLPPHDPAHPLLKYRRDAPVRFSGAWSVMLGGSGHHANHNHPAGWISSALYIVMPEMASNELPLAGAIDFGVPQAELGLDVSPTKTILPKPGDLVLFPSTMWHGTRPFESGDRITIAFDVAHPRQ